MTILVGVLCRDGIVIGADSAATFTAGHVRTIEQPTNKIDIIGDRIIMATTGAGGLKQRFSHTISTNIEHPFFQEDAITIAKNLSVLGITDFRSTGAPYQNQFGALVAYPAKGDMHLCEFALADFQPEMKTLRECWYVSMGSGQMIVDPFLGFFRDIFWVDGKLPSYQEGIFATVWSIQLAIDINAGGINRPIRVATLMLDKEGKPHARMLDVSEMEEHQAAVKGAKEHLRKYRDKTPSTPIPDPPQ